MLSSASPEVFSAIDSGTFRSTLQEHYAARGYALPTIDLWNINHTLISHSVGTDYYIAFLQDESTKVGSATVRELHVEDRAQQYFSWVTDLAEGRGNFGYGVAIYCEAICKALDAGKDFRTDPNGLTSKAVAMWQRFLNLHLAVEISPLTKAKTTTWDVRIPATEIVLP